MGEESPQLDPEDVGAIFEKIINDSKIKTRAAATALMDVQHDAVMGLREKFFQLNDIRDRFNDHMDEIIRALAVATSHLGDLYSETIMAELGVADVVVEIPDDEDDDEA